MNDEQLHIFEQPINGDSLKLACDHVVPKARRHPRNAEGWYAATWCPTCDRRRAVVSVIHPKANP